MNELSSRTLAIGCLAIATAVGTGGCTEGTGTTRWGGINESFRIKDELTTLKWEETHSSEETGERQSAVASAVAGIIEKALRDEAKRYIAGYSAGTHAEFNPSELEDGTLTLTRYANGLEDETTPASVWTIGLKKSTTESNSAFVRYQVVLKKVEMTLSKAKVSLFNDRRDVDASIAISIESMWVSSTNRLERHNLLLGGAATVRGIRVPRSSDDDKTPDPLAFTIAHHPLDSGTTESTAGETSRVKSGAESDSDNQSETTATKGVVLGYLTLPANTQVRSIVTVAVTERDASRAADLIDSAADLIEKNKDKISTTVESAIAAN